MAVEQQILQGIYSVFYVKKDHKPTAVSLMTLPRFLSVDRRRMFLTTRHPSFFISGAGDEVSSGVSDEVNSGDSCVSSGSFAGDGL